MFQTFRLSIIRSLFTVHSAMVNVIQVCRQLSSRIRMKLQFHPDPARKVSTNLYEFHPDPARKLSTNLYDIPLLSVQWINSWWYTDEMSETFRVSCQNKFVKLVHLVGFIIKKHPPCCSDQWRDFLDITNYTTKRKWKCLSVNCSECTSLVQRATE